MKAQGKSEAYHNVNNILRSSVTDRPRVQSICNMQMIDSGTSLLACLVAFTCKARTETWTRVSGSTFRSNET